MPFLDTWNATYEGIPADSENINLGANRIRDLKVNIRERVAVDHSFAGDANDGLHLHVELLPQGGTPTRVNAGDGVLYTQTVAGVVELIYADTAGHATQLTSNGGYAGGTLNGSLTVTGALGVSGNLTPVGPNGISEICGDVQFYLITDPSTTFNTINFAANARIYYNSTLTRFEIMVGGVVVAHFP